MDHEGNNIVPIHSGGTNAVHPIRQSKFSRAATHYYHRVKESLATRTTKLVCAIVLGLLAIVTLITFIFWLSLRPHRPRVRVEDFSFPVSSRSGSGPPQGAGAERVNFNVTVRNSNQAIGIWYDAVAVAVSYEDQVIGNASFPKRFFQQPKNTTVFAGSMGGAAALNRMARQWAGLVGGASRGLVLFRLEVTSGIRFKVASWWSTKQHRMHAKCMVGVGEDGSLLPAYKDNICPLYFN
ncbi:hypothetical protein DM860_001915 [Cuscuta australis]|uniref:Late embryogenesis abundant protein LEA-2 subgroup domain-containing protein n=1 Tax=Cuscuta australis TaxID=267555 RepID=A0A328DV96_9ASTE|nr:hypothetical protein DM860_001915 [Cuscuta australis]